MRNNLIDKQRKRLIDYFKSHTTNKNNFKVGVEFEHFIIHKNTLETVTYGEKNGVAHTLKELESKGWKGDYSEDNILGLSKGDINITLEPGAQFEVSINPKQTIIELEKIYIDFLKEIVPILEKKEQYMISMGYHPVSKIENIPFIPKERYKYMSQYFSDKGEYAHNMMKGTASIQIAIDYSDEEDCRKKFRLANLLSPILSLIFDNSPIFEGNIYPNNILRTDIWNKCDDDRSKIVPKSLDNEFSCSDYAEYILNTPPILIMKNNEFNFVGDKLVKDVFDPDEFTDKELEHILTMVFPDVRLKGFIEIRMMDAVPYPFNLAGVALIKGIMYSDKNVDILLDMFKDWDNEKIAIVKREIMANGFNSYIDGLDINEIIDKILKLALEGLCQNEKEYLNPIIEIVSQRENPAILIKKNIYKGLEKSIKCCILNNLLLEED
ncbi:glutamate--cysteine ligase [Clostridium sp. D2Q-14]|uniref:glutamate--cysteine ligase n=1 Tax=Anaeromonas gelatinilytica TaxID=2683194 RepID=UPI00193B6CAB|nr:glutamate-cysteine ligase family protein [Anaeromonas gelatinilytica]MBS4534512.1 glutamate--cysteine ligase [Anaeromonas gelatinilytica]